MAKMCGWADHLTVCSIYHLQTNVAMVTHGLMSDDQYFERSAKFSPERWLRETKNPAAGCPATATKPQNPFAFLPFGFGPRMCVGRRFAEMEVQVLITRYVKKCDEEYDHNKQCELSSLFISSILRNYRVEWEHGTMQYAVALISSPITELKFKFVPL